MLHRSKLIAVTLFFALLTCGTVVLLGIREDNRKQEQEAEKQAEQAAADELEFEVVRQLAEKKKAADKALQDALQKATRQEKEDTKEEAPEKKDKIQLTKDGSFVRLFGTFTTNQRSSDDEYEYLELACDQGGVSFTAGTERFAFEILTPAGWGGGWIEPGHLFAVPMKKGEMSQFKMRWKKK